MPCFKCSNGKYKFGRTGACKHATKAACDAANRGKEKRKPAPRKRKVYGSKTGMERAVRDRLNEDDGCTDC